MLLELIVDECGYALERLYPVVVPTSEYAVLDLGECIRRLDALEPRDEMLGVIGRLALERSSDDEDGAIRGEALHSGVERGERGAEACGTAVNTRTMLLEASRYPPWENAADARRCAKPSELPVFEPYRIYSGWSAISPFDAVELAPLLVVDTGARVGTASNFPRSLRGMAWM